MNIYAYVYIYIYILLEWLTKQAEVQLIQQCLYTHGKLKNPIVVQSLKLDVSGGLQNMTDSENCRL